jgi:hypothetical protein
VLFIFTTHIKILIKIFINVTCADLLIFKILFYKLLPEPLIFLRETFTAEEVESEATVCLSTKLLKCLGEVPFRPLQALDARLS